MKKIRAVFNMPGTGVRLFRNNVGQYTLPDGGRVAYGLCTGSSDLIGFESVLITPEMVGQTIGAFLGVEVKTPVGRVSKEQRVWDDLVKKFGGTNLILRSEKEAEEYLKHGRKSRFGTR